MNKAEIRKGASMDWNKELISKIDFEIISNLEEKQLIASKIADKVKDGEVIGFGSGSTSYLTAIAIAKKIKEQKINIIAIPTSYEMKLLCRYYQIPTASLLEKKPDWSFDGADEVTKEGWLLKGRGGAMFKEKLNIVNSKVTYILVDNTKIVDKLGTNFAVPIECYPETLNYVKEELMMLGATKLEIRTAEKKDGPVITENNNIILDVSFRKIEETLEKDIKAITGVVESGLFIGYNIEVIKE